MKYTLSLLYCTVVPIVGERGKKGLRYVVAQGRWTQWMEIVGMKECERFAGWENGWCTTASSREKCGSKTMCGFCSLAWTGVSRTCGKPNTLMKRKMSRVFGTCDSGCMCVYFFPCWTGGTVVGLSCFSVAAAPTPSRLLYEYLCFYFTVCA